MRIHRLNHNRFIQLNGLRPVTDLNMLDRGNPTPNGLFGSELFGFSQSERRAIPAYIDLKGKYLHPLAYYNLKYINRKFESLVLGTKYYKLTADGSIEEDAQNGETGLDFLYRIWPKLKFKETKSVFGTERIKNLTEGNVWVDKWIVLPAGFRDINFNEEGRPSYDVINDDYSSLTRMANSVSQQEQYGFVSNITKSRIQMLINKIHDEIVDKQIRSKYSTFKKYIMGKNVTFGARLVISAPRISAETFKDMQVRFNYMGVPLSTICSIFFPFVVYGVREFFQNEFVHGGKYPYTTESGEVKYTTLINPESAFSDEYIVKMIKRFMYGTSSRFDTINIPENTDGLKLKLKISGKFGKANTSIRRNITWTDILFIVCNEIIEQRHIYATRYPIEDNFGITPSKISLLTTNDTVPAIIGNKSYKFYPIVEPDKSSDRKFVDTLTPALAYVSGYGADFDGDQMSVTGVFTNEANKDADSHTKDKKNILTLTTENIRVAQRDFVVTYYRLTKHPVGPAIPEFTNLSRVVNW